MKSNSTKTHAQHLCYACHRTFPRKQSLFGHLKHCQKHADAKALKNATGFSFSRQPHRGAPGSKPNQVSNQGWTEDLMAGFMSHRADAERASAAEPSTSLHSRRRHLVQRAKQQAIDAFYSSQGTVTLAMRGEARRAIEHELGKAPLEEFPWPEILEWALSIRDRIYEPYFQQARETQAREQAQKREAVERALREQQEAEQAQSRKTIWLELARSQLAAGCARRGISSVDKLRLEGFVELRMTDLLNGHESEQQADETINFLLQQQFKIFDEQQAARKAAKNQQLADQIVDGMIALAPLGLTLAAPLLDKGKAWLDGLLQGGSETRSQTSAPVPSEQHKSDTESPDTCRERKNTSSNSDKHSFVSDPKQDQGVSSSQDP